MQLATRRPVVRRALPAALLLAVATACGRDETTAPPVAVAGTVTVNASQGWAYLSLEDGTVVTPADPLRSEAWDMAFNATSVRLNGGEGGIGDVTGYCVCQNSVTSPSNEELLAMTPASELADFTAVGAQSVPAAGSFVADQLTPALSGWHTGAGTSAAPAARAWLVRLHDSTTYAKLRVASIAGASAATPGQVTFETATQAGTAGALGAARTVAVTVPATGSVRVNLATGATTTGADWDIELQGWTIRVNGGASGAGKAAVATTESSFDAITDAYAGAAQAYRTDSYAGIFGQKPWYKYNLLGDHRMTPTFDVYLVRRGSQVYKVQLTDYYGPAGEVRRITVRYELIAG